MERVRIVEYVRSTPWAILPERLAAIMEVVGRWQAGEKLSDEQVRERIGAAEDRRQANSPEGGTVAVLGLTGIIAHRAHMVNRLSGPRGTSIELFRRDFREAVADPRVGSIVLDVDSPGGTVDGVAELADEIYEARGKKPVLAVANTLMASAAYWLAAQASEVVVTPTGEVGSIGVWTAHVEMSAQLAAEGIKVTPISAGKHKLDGNPWQPLTDEAKAFMQEKVQGYYEQFVAAVARARCVALDPAEVKGGTFMGAGRLLRSADAVALGLADHVATVDAVILEAAEFGGSGKGTGGRDLQETELWRQQLRLLKG